MKVTKWVDFGQDVEINIDSEDIRAAVAEAFAQKEDWLGEEDYGIRNITESLNCMAQFLNAFTDEEISQLNIAQRKVVAAYFLVAWGRFKMPEDSV